MDPNSIRDAIQNPNSKYRRKNNFKTPFFLQDSEKLKCRLLRFLNVEDLESVR